MSCDFPAALEAYGKALALRPDNPIAASNLGVTQLWTGRYADSVMSLELAARQAPKNYRIQANLGDAYRAIRKPGNAAAAYARSVALAREQLRLNPRDAIAHSYAATGLAKANHAAEAAAEVKQALDLDPKEPSILLDAGVVAAIAGRTAEAMDLLRKAVVAGYCRTIIARQPEFERFRNDPAFQAIVAAPPRAAGI
jgi:Flp pilus assembly protein TadD